MNKGDNMKKKLSIIWSIIQVIIIIFVVLVTVFVLCKNKYGYTEIANYNFSYISNEDTKYLKNTKKSDLLLVKKDNSIKQGDNIYYYDIYKNKYTIRQANIIKIDETSYYISESSSIEKDKIIGKEYKTVPKLGGILSFLETKLGFILCIIFPLIIIFIYQIYKFISTIKEEKQQDEKQSNGESIEKTTEIPEETSLIKESSEEEHKEEEETEIL